MLSATPTSSLWELNGIGLWEFSTRKRVKNSIRSFWPLAVRAKRTSWVWPMLEHLAFKQKGLKELLSYGVANCLNLLKLFEAGLNCIILLSMLLLSIPLNPFHTANVVA